MIYTRAAVPVRIFFMLASILVLVTGCGHVIGPEKSLQLYTLEPQVPAAAGQAGPVVAGQLSIDIPEAEASLDTNRIALNPTQGTMDYFANASWPDHLPVLLQSRLVESFEKDGRMASVARDTAGLRADYLLKSEIRSFQARYAAPDTAPDIVLRIDVTLVQVSTGKVIVRKEMSQQVRADQNTLPTIVSAFNSATGAILKDIVDWTVRGAPPLPPQENEIRRHR
jgi:cholesterol transport system auxiliary component